MHSHPTPGAYEPAILKVMGDALDTAWKEFKPKPKDAELARRLMAIAIIKAVRTGAIEPTTLVGSAIRALRAAIWEDREIAAAAAIRSRWTRLSLTYSVTPPQSAYH